MTGSDENSPARRLLLFVSGIPRCTAFIPLNSQFDFSSAPRLGFSLSGLFYDLNSKSLLCLCDCGTFYTHTHTHMNMMKKMNQLSNITCSKVKNLAPPVSDDRNASVTLEPRPQRRAIPEP